MSRVRVSLSDRRMSKVDGCPECLNHETPRSVSPTADGFRASYECTACRHTWTTSWAEEERDV